MKFDTINPRTGARSQIELPLPEAVMAAAKIDLAVSDFVRELARQHLPPGHLLAASDLRTP